MWRQIKVEIQKQQTPVQLTDWSFFLAALANSDKSRLLYVKLINKTFQELLSSDQNLL